MQYQRGPEKRLTSGPRATNDCFSFGSEMSLHNQPQAFPLTLSSVFPVCEVVSDYSHLSIGRRYVNSIHGALIRGILTRCPFLEELEPLDSCTGRGSIKRSVTARGVSGRLVTFCRQESEQKAVLLRIGLPNPC